MLCRVNTETNQHYDRIECNVDEIERRAKDLITSESVGEIADQIIEDGTLTLLVAAALKRDLNDIARVIENATYSYASHIADAEADYAQRGRGYGDIDDQPVW